MGDTNLKYPGLTKKQRATMSFHGMLVIIIGAVSYTHLTLPTTPYV